MSHIIFKMSFCNFVAVFMQVIQIKSRLSHTRPAKDLHFPSYALMQRLSMTLLLCLLLVEVQAGTCSQRSWILAIFTENTSEERQSICHTLTEKGKLYIYLCSVILSHWWNSEQFWLLYTTLIYSIIQPPDLTLSLLQDNQKQVWRRWWYRHERHRKVPTPSSLGKSLIFFLCETKPSQFSTAVNRCEKAIHRSQL